MDFLELTSAGRSEAAPGAALHANPGVVAFHVGAPGASVASLGAHAVRTDLHNQAVFLRWMRAHDF